MNLKKESNYLKEYTIVKTHEKKTLSYHGDIFKYKGTESGFLYFKRQILAASAICLFFWILISALDPVSLRGKGNLIVMLSYVLLLFLNVCSINAAIHLYLLSTHLERRMYDQYIVKFNIYTILLIVFSASALVGQIYSIIANHALLLNELMVTLCFFLLFITGVYSYKIQSRQIFENIGS